MERILAVASAFPYPLNHGGAVDMWNRLLGLKRLGFIVDLIATVKESPEQASIETVRNIVRQLWIIERQRGLTSALHFIPFQAQSRIGLKTISLRESYDAVLLESEHVGPMLDNPTLVAKLRILRVANDEPRFFRELSKSAGTMAERCFYAVEANKFDNYCKTVRSRCHLLWFISDWERARHVEKKPGDSQRAFFLPPDPGVKKMRPYSPGGDGALLVASLTFPPNLEGLEWYVEHVHPILCGVKGYSLTVAGRTDLHALRVVSRLQRSHANLFAHANPQDLDGLYDRCAVFINPVLRGAGVKVKTIHALHAGVPVVTTSIGMEGTALVDGKHIVVADSPTDFACAVAKLVEDRSFARRLVGSAQAFLADTYDHELNMSRSLSSVFGPQSSVMAERLR